MLAKLFGSSLPQLNPEQARARLEQDPKPVVLDVRQPEEFRAGHIAGARLIPLGELPVRMKELPRESELIVVCQSGSRSSSAAQQLHAQGYRVFNLRGGMTAWSRAGLPVKQGAGKEL